MIVFEKEEKDEHGDQARVQLGVGGKELDRMEIPDCCRHLQKVRHHQLHYSIQ